MTAESETKTIMLVEDDRDVRAALAAVLADEGFTVLVAPDGFDALASVENHRPDVIVLDWMMPVIGGGDFIRALRSEYHLMTPILVITAGRMDRNEVLATGADDFLEKPFDLGELIDRVRALAAANQGSAQPEPPAEG